MTENKIENNEVNDKTKIYKFNIKYSYEQRMHILHKLRTIWDRQFNKFGSVIVVLWNNEISNNEPFDFYKAYEYRTNGIVISFRITDFENYSDNEWVDNVPLENVLGIALRRKRASKKESE
jgi:hypothetical protein